jgi:hypothetical protein
MWLFRFLKANLYQITILLLLIAVTTLSILYRNDRRFIQDLRIQMQGLSTDHQNELSRLQDDIDEYESNDKSTLDNITALWQSLDMLLVAGGFNDKKCFDDPLSDDYIDRCVHFVDIFTSQRTCGGPRKNKKYAANNGCMKCDEGYSIPDHELKRLIEQGFPCSNPKPVS